MKMRILLIAAMLAALSNRAEAKSWVVDYQHSHLGNCRPNLGSKDAENTLG